MNERDTEARLHIRKVREDIKENGGLLLATKNGMQRFCGGSVDDFTGSAVLIQKGYPEKEQLKRFIGR